MPATGRWQTRSAIQTGKEKLLGVLQGKKLQLCDKKKKKEKKKFWFYVNHNL